MVNLQQLAGDGYDKKVVDIMNPLLAGYTVRRGFLCNIVDLEIAFILLQ